MPEPAKLESVPPVTVTSAAVKLTLASDRVKVTVALSPAPRLVLGLLTMTVGGVTSRLIVKLAVLLVSAPSWLLLPEASVKRLLAT